MTALEAAGVYVGVNVLLLFYLSMRVVARRFSTRISLGDGGDEELNLRCRVHGNASEYIPATLLVLFTGAMLGFSVLVVHIIGAGFTLGRLLHAFGLSKTVLAARQVGMILTWVFMLAAALGVTYVALT
jgi:uncharacterized membrane protein YecN with MAPEG domain